MTLPSDCDSVIGVQQEHKVKKSLVIHDKALLGRAYRTKPLRRLREGGREGGRGRRGRGEWEEEGGGEGGEEGAGGEVRGGLC